jgi:hypothetical protein
MGWKFTFFVALLVVGGIGWYLWGVIKTAPKEATLPGYVDTLQRQEQKAHAVANMANLEMVKSAVEKYRGERGSLPPSLQDLVPLFMDHVPGGVVYDPTTGIVSAAQ